MRGKKRHQRKAIEVATANFKAGVLNRPEVTAVASDQERVCVFYDGTLDVEKIRRELPDGVICDVREARFGFAPQITDDTRVEMCDERFIGGIGVAPLGVDEAVGTLGTIVKDRNSMRLMGLTAAHIVDSLEDGTLIQWIKADGTPAETVGTFHKSRSNYNGGRQPNLHFNERMDAAVIPLSERVEYPSEVAGIGRVHGIGAAKVGMRLRKWGQKTGLRHGIVDTTNLTVKIVDGGREFRFTNQIGVIADPAQKKPFAAPGDSGAVVVDNAQQVVGLYFASNEDGTYGVVTPIGAVFDALQVDLHTETLYGLEKDIDNSVREELAFMKRLHAKRMFTNSPENLIRRTKSIQFFFSDGSCDDC
jgi:hypothetical protein